MDTTTYEVYTRRGTSSEMTMRLIEDLLTDRLSSDYRRIWVQGSTSRIMFTIFDSRGYTIRTLNTGGLRQFRHDGVLNDEIVYMERFLETLRVGVLSDFMN